MAYLSVRPRSLASLLKVAGSSLVLAGIFSCAPAPPQAASSSQCSGTPSDNKAVVLAFFDQGLVKHSPKNAFAAFTTEDMVEHKPDVPDGTRDAVVTYLEQLIQQLPRAKWEVLRSAAEGDLVFLHARFTPDEGAPAYAIADVFRLKNCKIVEHWDVVGPPRDGQPNPLSRF
jgi:predicted SnoaL-like aldol condensation-catalyzing enzyme